MTDSQQNLRLAGLQSQRQRSTTSQRQRSPLGGLVQEFEQAVGDFKQSLSPRGAGTPDRLATPSTLLDSSQTSPLRTASRSTSPNLGVRVASPRSGRDHVSLVTDAVLDTRIEHLTLAMHAHIAHAIREEITSFGSTLQGSFNALEARCEALEKKGGGDAQELELQEHDHRALVERIDGLQRQSAEQAQRVAQRLEQLGHTGSQALDSLQLLVPRLDKMAQDHEESVVELDTELKRLEAMLHGPAPSVEADLQKIFQEMDDFKDQLHGLSQAQIQDQNVSTEVNQFQEELSQRVDDEMKLLKGKVDETTHMVQEGLTGLHSKLCTDLKNLQADREAASNVFDPPGPGIGAVILGEPPVREEAADDDCRWELQYKALEIETTASKAHQPATLGLAELQHKMDQKLDMSPSRVDEFVTRHEATLQQLGEVGKQYSAVQQCVDDLRGEIDSVRSDLDVLMTDKVLKHMRSIPSLCTAGAPGGTTVYSE